MSGQHDQAAPLPEAAEHHVGACGWVRVPDHDSPGGEAWEMPDGSVILLPRGTRPVLITCAGWGGRP